MWAKPLWEFHWMRRWARGKEVNDRVHVRGAMKRLMKENSRNTVILQGVALWGTPSGTMCHELDKVWNLDLFKIKNHSSCAWKSAWLKRLLANKNMQDQLCSLFSFFSHFETPHWSLWLSQKRKIDSFIFLLGTVHADLHATSQQEIPVMSLANMTSVNSCTCITAWKKAWTTSPWKNVLLLPSSWSV